MTANAGSISVSLPSSSVLTAFIVMRQQGISANLMSLGGIAIAIGAMVDAAVMRTAKNAGTGWRGLGRGRPGAGSEVMQRIAAPMVGGMLSAPLLSMLLLPAAFELIERRRMRRRRCKREPA